MDLTVFYVFLAVGITFGITYVVTQLRDKGKLKQEDLMFVMQLLNLSKRVVSELRLDKESEIVTISELVIDGLDYSISHFTEPKDIIENAYEFALDMSRVFNKELTEERKILLKDLIVIALSTKYKNEVE